MNGFFDSDRIIDYIDTGIALNPNCGVYRRVSLGNRIGGLLLFGPNLYEDFTMGNDFTKLIGSILILLYGSIDHASDVVG